MALKVGSIVGNALGLEGTADGAGVVIREGLEEGFIEGMALGGDVGVTEG